MKKCPFCKKEIRVSAAICPFCNRTLIESVPLGRPYSGQESKDRTQTSYYAASAKVSLSRRLLKLLKKSKVVVLLTLIILISIIWSIKSASSEPLITPSAVSDNKLIQEVPAEHVPYHSLPNGAVLLSNDEWLQGSGVLTISNGTNSDAIVKLATINKEKVYHVYVRANESYSIKNISDGTYKLAFEFGSNWNSTQGKFLVNQSASSFDDSFDFETSVTDNGNYTDTHYSTYEITLNPVVDGTATTSSLDQDQFDSY